jgi:uncharacterized protein YecE (DUF72 family)
VARCCVGTSGWSYDSWLGSFYPEDLPRNQWIEFYAKRFDSVELNATFYRTLPEAMFKAWVRRTPPGFQFAVKGSRFITHVHRLDVEQASIEKQMQQARLLRDRLGPILFQLPPRWPCDPARLERFLRRLPADAVFAFEFRDTSWFDGRVYKVLRKYGVAFCIYHMHDRESPLMATGPVVYLRFHGTKGLYAGAYGSKLQPWAKRIKGWLAEGRDVYAYFNNTGWGEAVEDAALLRRLTGG